MLPLLSADTRISERVQGSFVLSGDLPGFLRVTSQQEFRVLDPRWKTAAACFNFASGAMSTLLSPDPEKGMAGRCVQGLMDVLEKNYSGDVTRMPYVVNKEAFK